MAQARSLVMPAGARGTYHVISRCTRRAFLLGDRYAHRKEWAAESLASLLSCFAIDLQAYAIMSNHLHLVLRPRPDLAAGWSSQQAALLGLQQFPMRVGNGTDVLPITPELVERRGADGESVQVYRERLSSITWFMKLFKQRLARRANAEDQCRGHFWESRFLTVPLLDAGAVFACMAYVDRNPMRAGMARSLAASRYCSATARMGSDQAFGDGEQALNRLLVPISRCAPVESWTGEQGFGQLRAPDYRALLDPELDADRSMRVARRLGLDPALWAVRSGEPGLFQGVAVGNRQAREAFAPSQGRRIIADKTGIWHGSV